jgi:hypothetical protein
MKTKKQLTDLLPLGIALLCLFTLISGGFLVNKVSFAEIWKAFLDVLGF